MNLYKPFKLIERYSPTIKAKDLKDHKIFDAITLNSKNAESVKKFIDSHVNAVVSEDAKTIIIAEKGKITVGDVTYDDGSVFIIHEHELMIYRLNLLSTRFSILPSSNELDSAANEGYITDEEYNYFKEQYKLNAPVSIDSFNHWSENLSVARAEIVQIMEKSQTESNSKVSLDAKSKKYGEYCSAILGFIIACARTNVPHTLEVIKINNVDIYEIKIDYDRIKNLLESAFCGFIYEDDGLYANNLIYVTTTPTGETWRPDTRINKWLIHYGISEFYININYSANLAKIYFSNEGMF